MTIAAPSARARSGVVWYGAKIAPATKDFLQRLRFSVDDTSLPAFWAAESTMSGLAAVVFVQDPKRPRQIVYELEKQAARLLDYDCLVFVIAEARWASLVTRALVRKRIPSIFPENGYSVVFDGRKTRNSTAVKEFLLPYALVHHALPSPDNAIVNFIVQYGSEQIPIADKPGVFDIAGPGKDGLSRQDRLMLRRGFYNCSEVHIKKLEEGKSGVTVYLAHALLRDLVLKRRPLPFFVKVGQRNKIAREWEAYRDRVRPFVPFHLGPRLLEDRCHLGAYNGIIVGDFVEDSESLAACSLGARGATPIGTLFDRTLRGWHSLAAIKKVRLKSPLRPLIQEMVPWYRVNGARRMGAKRTPQQLKANLKGRRSERVLWGPIHGDLHASNARVRGSDAILIDFLSSREGPLLSDPAALEVSLIVRVPGDDDFDPSAWVRVVRPLFQQDFLRWPPTIGDPREQYAWIVSTLRQVRLHALAMEKRPGQYADVLAYRLLQAAAKDPKASGPENFRRAAAYWLADSLLDMVW